MKQKLLSVLLIFLLVSEISNSGPRHDRISKQGGSLVPDENNPFSSVSIFEVNTSPAFENNQTGSAYLIGPEIQITGLTGYYDYQTNGECKHYLNRVDAVNLYAIFMTAIDSLNPSVTRRTKYACSGDDGTTWTDIGQVPNGIRSGFCSLTSKSDGSAVIMNNYNFPPNLYASANINPDGGPCTGVFTSRQGPFISADVARLSNSNILTAGVTYQGGVVTDTVATSVFNTSTNTFGPLVRIAPKSRGWTDAAGPAGRALVVIRTYNGLSATQSTDNGITWSPPNILIQSSDTLGPFFGLDAIYDASGNYYIAFNSTNMNGSYASAKLWVLKNGAILSLVAQHSGINGIPEAANFPLHADAGICTIDHPSLSISADQSIIFVGYSVQYQNDTLNGYNKCHIYFSYASLSTMTFNPPIRITNSGFGSFDERYCSLNQSAPTITNQGVTLFVSYQKDRQPGSFVFNDNAPASRDSLMFRKITYLSIPPGIRHIGNEIPKTYSLHQNYPNPFNPATKISFDLPNSGIVLLEVYDDAGKLVARLINECLRPGTYEYEYNASELSSGIYFYTITAGDFRNTRKMVLLK